MPSALNNLPSRAGHVAGQILAIARRNGMKPGDRLIEQRLADELGLSRGPIRAGLRALAADGWAVAQPNCGYAIATNPTSRLARASVLQSEQLYRRIADDILDGRLPLVVAELELLRRYELSRPALARLLERIASEGWVVRLPGNGWKFNEAYTRPEVMEHVQAFRRLIEPSALVEPAYRLANEVLQRIRTEQAGFLQRGLKHLTFSEIFSSGCRFHEDVIAACGNPFHLETLKRINAVRRLYAYRHYADFASITDHISEHLELLDLIEAGRNKAAARVMTQHLSRSPLQKVSKFQSRT